MHEIECPGCEATLTFYAGSTVLNGDSTAHYYCGNCQKHYINHNGNITENKVIQFPTYDDTNYEDLEEPPF